MRINVISITKTRVDKTSTLVAAMYLMAATLLTGCAVGPLYTHETARTVGKSHTELEGGLGRAGAVAKLDAGITENLDVGVQAEFFSTGVWAKYALVNNKEDGASFATALGAGKNPDGKHVYADLIGSHLHDDWEPYGNLRYVQVHLNKKSYPSPFGDVQIDKSNFDYGQFFLGARYWINPRWFLSLEASQLSYNPHIITGASLGYRN